MPTWRISQCLPASVSPEISLRMSPQRAPVGVSAERSRGPLPRQLPRASPQSAPMPKALSILLCLPLLFPWTVQGIGDSAAYFEKHIRPLLIKHCYECHSHESGKAKGGLQLDSGRTLLVTRRCRWLPATRRATLNPGDRRRPAYARRGEMTT
mgnify:CR=1 FL=1